MLEQAELGRAERDRRAAAAHAVRGDVHLDVGISQLLAGQRRPHPAKHGADAGDQLARAERLGDIIVGAGLEAADAVALLAARGQHDDRHVGRRRAAAQAAADFDPADALDHPVEEDDVGPHFIGQHQRFLAVAGAGHLVTCALEMIGEQIGERAVVFDQQETLCSHRSASISAILPGRSAMCSPVAA